MKIARFFLKNSPTWLDLPLAEGQNMAGLITVMKTEGLIYCDAWAVREDAWSFIAIVDLPAQTAPGWKPTIVSGPWTPGSAPPNTP